MSDRIGLSADTWIEAMDGVEYLVTTRNAVAIELLSSGNLEAQNGVRSVYGHKWGRVAPKNDLVWLWCGPWRIPLTACWEIYRYHEGEPWIGEVNGLLVADIGERSMRHALPTIHRRAAIVADTAEQFRAFYDAIKPEDTTDG